MARSDTFYTTTCMLQVNTICYVCNLLAMLIVKKCDPFTHITKTTEASCSWVVILFIFSAVWWGDDAWGERHTWHEHELMFGWCSSVNMFNRNTFDCWHGKMFTKDRYYLLIGLMYLHCCRICLTCRILYSIRSCID